MDIVIKRVINKNGLLAKVVLETEAFDVTCNLCESKEGKKYIQFPQREYTINNEKKYEYQVWFKGDYKDLIYRAVRRYEEEIGSTGPKDELPF